QGASARRTLTVTKVGPFTGGRGMNRALLFALLVCASPGPLAAQNRNANIIGLVRDGTGAVLPGVTVTVRAVATNQTRQTVTDEHGRYAFPNQDIGQNEIAA